MLGATEFITPLLTFDSGEGFDDAKRYERVYKTRPA